MTELKKPIRGKVARILNARELALNVGARDGVEVGMIFQVLDPAGEDIVDPDTGALLGSIFRPKLKVKVTRSEEALSLASTYRASRVNKGGDGGFSVLEISRLLQPPNWVTTHETLKASEHDWEDLAEEDSFVKTGDPVVQVVEADSTKEDKEKEVIQVDTSDSE